MKLVVLYTNKQLLLLKGENIFCNWIVENYDSFQKRQFDFKTLIKEKILL